jgi:hypothetical protein
MHLLIWQFSDASQASLNAHLLGQHPRLACYCLLCGRPSGFLATYAVKCSSFSVMNRGTSRRSPCSAIGHTAYRSVAEGNALLERRVFLFMACLCFCFSPVQPALVPFPVSLCPCRSVLLILLTTSLGGAWLLEQPQNSTMEFYPTFRAMLLNLVSIDARSAPRLENPTHACGHDASVAASVRFCWCQRH